MQTRLFDYLIRQVSNLNVIFTYITYFWMTSPIIPLIMCVFPDVQTTFSGISAVPSWVIWLASKPICIAHRQLSISVRGYQFPDKRCQTCWINTLTCRPESTGPTTAICHVCTTTDYHEAEWQRHKFNSKEWIMLKDYRHTFYGTRCLSVSLPYCILNFTFLLRTVFGQQWYRFFHSVILSPFWVTWRHTARDHNTRSGRFTIDTNPVDLPQLPKY